MTGVSVGSADQSGSLRRIAASESDTVSPANRLRQTSVFEGDRLSCVGYGDNDGLSAILTAEWSGTPKTVEGLIFPGDMPPMPEFPSSE